MQHEYKLYLKVRFISCKRCLKYDYKAIDPFYNLKHDKPILKCRYVKLFLNVSWDMVLYD